MEVDVLVRPLSRYFLFRSEYESDNQSSSPSVPITGTDKFRYYDSDGTLYEITYEDLASALFAETGTLTNKRVTPRITTITSSATPTINTDNCDCVTITALAADITSMTSGLSGTPTNFQKLIIRIKDDGTARNITWGASYVNRGVALPTTTIVSKVTTVGLEYDSVAAVWGCIGTSQEPA